MWVCRVSLVSAGLLALIAPSAARAETLLIATPAGNAAATAHGASLGATPFVARFAARVQASGWTTEAATAAQRERIIGLLGCDTSLCAFAGLSSLRVDAVVAPSLWQRVDGGRELAMSVQGPSGHAVELVVAVDPARPMDAADAIAVRFLEAWPDLRGAPGQALDDADPVDGVDGVGAGARVAARRPPRAAARSGANGAIGIALLAASVAPIAIGAAAIARDGRCVNVDRQNACTIGSDGRIERYHAGARSYAWLSAGIAALGVGVYVIAAGPIRLQPAVELSSTGAVLGVVGSF